MLFDLEDLKDIVGAGLMVFSIVIGAGLAAILIFILGRILE